MRRTLKIEALTGVALDFAVAKCVCEHLSELEIYSYGIFYIGEPYNPSICWTHGGPIIDRENIELEDSKDLAKGKKFARMRRVDFGFGFFGETNLEAAMRCYVASKLGDEVELPEELS